MAHQTPAYLFRSTINVEPYAPERQEQLSTGMYVLVDMRCRGCCTPLGWRYISALSEVGTPPSAAGVCTLGATLHLAGAGWQVAMRTWSHGWPGTQAC